jgi:hypothetical protein
MYHALSLDSIHHSTQCRPLKDWRLAAVAGTPAAAVKGQLAVRGCNHHNLYKISPKLPPNRQHSEQP